MFCKFTLIMRKIIIFKRTPAICHYKKTDFDAFITKISKFAVVLCSLLFTVQSVNNKRRFRDGSRSWVNRRKEIQRVVYQSRRYTTWVTFPSQRRGSSKNSLENLIEKTVNCAFWDYFSWMLVHFSSKILLCFFITALGHMKRNFFPS